MEVTLSLLDASLKNRELITSHQVWEKGKLFWTSCERRLGETIFLKGKLVSK